MSQTETLSEYVDGLVVPDFVDRAWLVEKVLAPLAIDPDGALADLCEENLIEATASDRVPFQMRGGNWRINVAGTAFRTVLTTALLGAGLYVHGSPDIPTELLAAVVPLVVDVERVRLNRQDRLLLAPLRIASSGLEGMAVSPHVLYNRLDPAIQQQLSQGDFVGFCDRLIEAGQMDDAGLDDVRPRPADRPAWIRITWT